MIDFFQAFADGLEAERRWPKRRAVLSLVNRFLGQEMRLTSRKRSNGELRTFVFEQLAGAPPGFIPVEEGLLPVFDQVAEGVRMIDLDAAERLEAVADGVVYTWAEGQEQPTVKVPKAAMQSDTSEPRCTYRSIVPMDLESTRALFDQQPGGTFTSEEALLEHRAELRRRLLSGDR